VKSDVREGIGELDEALPAIGSVFDERFAIEQMLGSGGMGCVLLARHLELEQRVALKLLRPGRHDSQRGALRLVREARASARLKSEHVVRVFDVVSRQKAAPYIVMEYLDGLDLAHYIARQGPLSVSEAASLVAQACEAVGEGHRMGIVHRDLKPSNVFLCDRGVAGLFVKVLDFGISKTEDESAEALTHSHALLGSPVYSAPEQLQASHDVDARADIWSLGVVLYECVTGHRPFEGGSLARICTHILQEPPTPLESHRGDLPADFRAIVLRCLEKQPTDRYASVEALLGALAPFAPQAVSSARAYLDGVAGSPRVASQPTRSSSVPGPDTLTGSTEYDTRVAQARHQAQFKVGWMFWLAALVAALGAFWAYHRSNVAARDGALVSAAAPASPPLTPSSAAPIPSAQPALPATALPSAAVPPLLADSARPTTPAAPARFPSRKAPSRAAASSTPWVESR
jgi:serine/threonine-protein kinase